MKFNISNNNLNSTHSLTERREGNITYLTLQVSFSEPTIPEPLIVSWFFDSADCISTWNPHCGWNGLGFEWGFVDVQSRLASWMPIQSLVSPTGKNKLTIAVSDVDTPMTVCTGLREEDATVACQIQFFTRPINPTLSYTAVIRLDTSDVPFYDSIYSVTDWWENDCGYVPAYVPEAARRPMDSLWYSFHQLLDRDEILKECRASKAIGLDTVIIDDGWQTEDNNRGYGFCGDWQVAESKMGDMASLVSALHDIGMKVILWYSVPFVGIHSAKYEEFKDYFLDECGGLGGDSFALDPRYKKVRDYLVSTYKYAIDNWKLDGFKLDFIDSFALRGKSLEPDSRRDCSSLEEGLHALLAEIKTTLTAVNPDVMIEFRQSYVGPSIRKYGNMLRVNDCPCDTIKNRVGTVNLRLTSGKTAVHSDMLMWSMNDTVENAALQLTSVLYSVPQISVRVDKLPADHLKMLKNYLDFWYANSKILLDGKLSASNPECNYSLVRSTINDKSVITAYSTPVIDINTDEAIAVNASMHHALIIKNAAGKCYRTVNCMGEEIEHGTIKSALTELKVPTAGIIYIS